LKPSFLKILLNPKTIIGVFVSIFGVYWAFKDFNFIDFKSSINNIKLLWVIIASCLLVISVWFRAIRWKLLFKSNDPVTTKILFKNEMIGYFGNNVLPLRLGELLRCYILGKETGLSKSYTFGTIILERILDTFGLGVFIIMLMSIVTVQEQIENYLMIGVVFAIFVSVIVFLIIKIIPKFDSKNKILLTIQQILDSFSHFGKQNKLSLLGLTIIIWSIYWIDVHLIQLSLGLQLTLSQSLLILIISSMVLSIPSAPGMIGTFHAGVKFVMVDLLDKSPNIANSFAIILHAYGYILYVIIGAIFFMKSHFHKHAITKIMSTENSVGLYKKSP
jgi:hypothetical protein